MIDETIKNRISKMLPILSESQRRKFLGVEAIPFGHGGIQALSRFTGAFRSTITLGVKEATLAIADPKARPSAKETGRVRSPVGGRKKIK